MIKTEKFEKIEVVSQAEFRRWLDINHQREDSVWLVTFKKQMPEKYVSVDAVLDELICFGWIDGIRRKLDDERTMQLISKRKAQHWAKTYKERAERLIQEGKMQTAGQKSIEEGKASGLWNFMDDVDALITPQDLVAVLENKASACAHFNAYPDAYKRNILRWLKLAKTSATRQKRIGIIAETSAVNARISQM